MEINWNLLQPVDTGAAVQQGFATGVALVSHVQRQHALQSYLQNPDSDQAYNALAAYDPNAAATIQHQQMLRHKMAIEAQQEAEVRDIGAQVASGDVTGGRARALGSGNFDLAKQIGELSDDQLKKSAAFWEKAGPIAYRLKELGDPAKQRELWAQARPILEATGADPQIIAQFNPTNPTQLDAAINTAQTIAQQIEQRKVVWHQQGEQPSFATDSMGRPIGSQNPYANGSPAPAPAPAAQGGFDASVDHVLGNEGGYNASDMNGKPVNFGINQGANPDINVKNLTREQAKQIYHDRYWVPSGAENLPPNLQAPYFDVYIRNPKIAKEALDASKGDPQKFMELSSGYFQHLGQSGSGQKYAKAWANRDSKNLQIATGGSVKSADGAPHIASKSDFDALPSGTEFIAPDGSRRVKP